MSFQTADKMVKRLQVPAPSTAPHRTPCLVEVWKWDFEIYAMARSLNIETSRARDAAEAHRREPTADTRQAHIDISIRISEKELELYNILNTFVSSKRLED